jgi:hypothetical protein
VFSISAAKKCLDLGVLLGILAREQKSVGKGFVGASQMRIGTVPLKKSVSLMQRKMLNPTMIIPLHPQEVM